MKRFLIVLTALILGYLAYDTARYYLGWYIDLQPDVPVSAFMSTDAQHLYMDRGAGPEEFTVKGVNLGVGIPGEWATDYAVSKETYLRWFAQMQEMGANTVRVYITLHDDFYNAFYEYNTAREEANEEPLWLIHGVWVNDYIQNSHRDAYDKDFLETFVRDGRTLVDVLHGNKKISLGRGTGSGFYNKDVSRWVIGYIKLFLEWVGYFFIAYLIGYSTFLFLSVVVGSLELYKHRRQEMFKSILPSDYYLPISIIVPAYNEEVTVADTVRSLLTLEYRAYEIIVVDDGSKDRTSEVLAETFDMHLVHRPIRRQINCQREEYVYETRAQKVPVTLIRKKNGGKADALNMGINAANFPYFICMDADSVLQYDSLRRIAQPVLEDGKVVAVGGIVRISNDVELENGRVKRYRLPRSILAFMQVLEYDRSFLASRILFDRFNGSLIISGAFGLFKKDTVIAVGGYDNKTMGEDMELVVKLHEYCTINGIDYAIRYATDAICWTQVPERLRDLCKQRKRWHLGLFQSMYKHRVMFSNHRFGAVSFVSYLYFLIYELLSPFIEVFGVFTMVLAWWCDLINVPFMLLFFLIYAVFGGVLTLTAFFSRIYTADLSVSFRDGVKAVCLCLFELVFLRFILAWVRCTAFIGYRKKKLSWGRIERRKIDLK